MESKQLELIIGSSDDANVKEMIDRAVAFADQSTYPELTEVATDVYATV